MDRHLATSGLCLAVFLGACHVINYGSNLPDGGLCPDDGGGTATLTGPQAFPVVTALESRLAYQTELFDGGQFAGWSDAGAQFIQFVLLGTPVGVPCNDDAGGCQTADRLELSLVSQADGGSWNGVYLLDGGSAGLGVILPLLDGGVLYFAAVSGQIQIASTQDCSISGSFAASLQPWPDGGADAGSPLSGTFQAAYAP